MKSLVFTGAGTPAGTLRRVRVVGGTPIALFGEPIAASTPALVQLA